MIKNSTEATGPQNEGAVADSESHLLKRKKKCGCSSVICRHQFFEPHSEWAERRDRILSLTPKEKALDQKDCLKTIHGIFQIEGEKFLNGELSFKDFKNSYLEMGRNFSALEFSISTITATREQKESVEEARQIMEKILLHKLKLRKEGKIENSKL